MQQHKQLYTSESLGLGDSNDQGVYVSHITPKEKGKISKLVGAKCTISAVMNDSKVEILFDTGAQVSVISVEQLAKYFPRIMIRDVKTLLGDDKNLN